MSPEVFEKLRLPAKLIRASSPHAVSANYRSHFNRSLTAKAGELAQNFYDEFHRLHVF